MKHKEVIEKINQDIPLIVLSAEDFCFSMKDTISLDIEASIEKELLSEQLCRALEVIDSKLRNSKLNKTFKEFSLYSETDLEGNIVEDTTIIFSLKR